VLSLMRARPVILIGILLALLVGMGLFWALREREPTPEELVRQALDETATAEQREVAAVRLGQMGKRANGHLRQVLAASQTAEVRAATIWGLSAQWDYESMPALLDALDDPSPLVRERACAAVETMIAFDSGYKAHASAESRKAAAKKMLDVWNRYKDSPPYQRWRKELEKREKQ
jgi:hypothetical protein